LFVSVVSIAELRFGINLLGMTPQRTDLQTWLDGTMRPAFAGRVLEMPEDVILHGAS
jgi:hypothetical protein